VGSRLYGFPCFPHSVISMACFGFAASRKTSHWPESQLRHIEFAEFDVAEVDSEEFLVHLLETEVFKREHLADKDPILVPAYVSTRVHAPGLEASWIGELTDGSGQQDGTALVEACRHRVVDSFVRSPPTPSPTTWPTT